MIQHVIWDWNGTLLDDAQACVDALNVLLRQRRLPAISMFLLLYPRFLMSANSFPTVSQ